MTLSKALEILEKNKGILDGDTCYRICKVSCHDCIVHKYFGVTYCDAQKGWHVLLEYI